MTRQTSTLARFISAAIALMLIPVSTFAQTAPSPDAAGAARGKFRAACAADVQKFCANVERGKGQIRGCLASHQGEVSDACKAVMAERTKQQ